MRECGRRSAIAVLRASADAADPDEAADQAVVVTARAQWEGREWEKALGNLGDIKKGDPAKVTVEILPRERV